MDVKTAFLQAPLLDLQRGGKQLITSVRAPHILRERGITTCRFFFLAPFCVCVGSPQGQRYLREPAGVCSQAAREQLTQRHLLVVRWVAGPRDGQLEGRAGVRPERCERGLGFPALVQSLASGRCAPRRPLASPCPCEQSQERQGAAADSPANFNAEDNQAAAQSLPQFRVSSVFAVDCLVEGEAQLVVSPWAGLAIPSDWAHDCGVHRDLGALPYGESIGDNLYYAPSVAGWYVKVEVTEGDMRCDAGSRLFADACWRSLKGAGSAG